MLDERTLKGDLFIFDTSTALSTSLRFWIYDLDVFNRQSLIENRQLISHFG